MIHYHTKHDAQSSHHQILRIVREIYESPILDVGSAQGMLGQGLAGSGLTIDAIEPDSGWADVARPFYRTVHNCSIETASLAQSHYRIVVCADVLEHLPDPASALRRLRAAATSDATFIISVPNVAHLSVRLLLLAGRFPRMERGILDKTHVRFYTRKTARKFLEQNGYEIVTEKMTVMPVELAFGLSAENPLMRVMNLMLAFVTAAMPGVFGYQCIFAARPAKKKAN